MKAREVCTTHFPVGEPPKLQPPNSLGDDAFAGESRTFTVARVVTRSAAYPSPPHPNLASPHTFREMPKEMQNAKKKTEGRVARGVAAAMWRSLDEVHEIHEAARAVCDRCFVAIEVMGCCCLVVESSPSDVVRLQKVILSLYARSILGWRDREGRVHGGVVETVSCRYDSCRLKPCRLDPCRPDQRRWATRRRGAR